MIDGETAEVKEAGGFYIIPADAVKGGAKISARFPMGITAHNLQDGENTYAFCYGPYLLSARLGTAKISETSHGVAVRVSAGKSCESDELKITTGESVSEFIGNIDRHLARREDSMEFDLTGVETPLVFTTHFDQYRESYGIYWRFG